MATIVADDDDVGGGAVRTLAALVEDFVGVVVEVILVALLGLLLRGEPSGGDTLSPSSLSRLRCATVVDPLSSLIFIRS